MIFGKRKKGNLLIISGDAGGAEILSRICKKIKWNKFYYLIGPAKNIFNKKHTIKHTNLKEKISSVDALICTTSFNDRSYYDSIQFAKKKGIYSILVLDHWTFYKERLIKNKNDFLPDEVVVFDKYASRILKKLFPLIKVRIIENPYLKEMIKGIKEQSKKTMKNSFNILYCTDSTQVMKTSLNKKTKRIYGYSEFEALEYFFENINNLMRKIDLITIRIHPSEKTDKYDKIIKKYSSKFKIKKNRKVDLIKQISISDTIVGCETFPMVIGLYAKKNVVCSIPPKGKKSPLPFKKIKYLRDFV